MFVIDSVSKQFGSSVTALENVSLKIPKGQFCVLLGSSGAGKSTLMKMFTGMVSPTSGRVSFANVPVVKKNFKQVREQIGSIHQQFNLVQRISVLDNVLAGALPDISLVRVLLKWFPLKMKRHACELIEQVGLGEEHLYRRAAKLSGGQQQRVAIARAFMLKPSLILADEPVASLDPEIGANILKLLKDCSRGTGATVLCSLHQLEFAKRFADRVVGLANGKTIFDGKPSDLSQKVIDRIYK